MDDINKNLEIIYSNPEINNCEINVPADNQTRVVIDLENANGMLTPLKDDYAYRSFDIVKLLQFIKSLGYQIVETFAYQFKKDAIGNFEKFLTYKKINYKTADGTDYKNADEIIIDDLLALANKNLDDKKINHVLLVSGDIHFIDSIKNLQDNGINTSICSSEKSLNKEYLDMPNLTVHCLDQTKLVRLSERKRIRRSNSTQNIINNGASHNDILSDDNNAKRSSGNTQLKINVPAEIIEEKITDMILTLVDATERLVEINIY